ncbi:MAG: hypothetical protein EBZ42_12005 [Betaproteobacteria bacterium]|nr:hypothetical protein [Betaproteobacteria bacterium]
MSKPLGVGVLSAALKKEQLSDAAYQELIAITTNLKEKRTAKQTKKQTQTGQEPTFFTLNRCESHKKSPVLKASKNCGIALSANPKP